MLAAWLAAVVAVLSENPGSDDYSYDEYSYSPGHDHYSYSLYEDMVRVAFEA